MPDRYYFVCRLKKCNALIVHAPSDLLIGVCVHRVAVMLCAQVVFLARLIGVNYIEV